VQRCGQSRKVAFDKLFTDDDGIEKVAASASVFLGNIRAQKSLFPQLLPGASGNNAFFLPFFNMGHYFFVEIFPEALSEDIMLRCVRNNIHRLAPPLLSSKTGTGVHEDISFSCLYLIAFPCL
jgi:hypothetical protein